jgi:hypothetical protein
MLEACAIVEDDIGVLGLQLQQFFYIRPWDVGRYASL